MQFLLKDREKVQRLKIVNHLAERGVALIQAFNPVLTKQEDQRRYLLHVVEEHRKQFPPARKSAIIKGLIL